MSRSDTDFRPPLPGECDPRYARERATLARWLDTSRDHQRFVIEPGPAHIRELSEQSLPTTDVTYTQRVLTRRKVYAPAPFVGRPFGYYWWTAIDNDGCGIAGSEVWPMPIDSGPLWNRYLMESDEMAPVRAYRDGFDDGYAAAKRKFTATEETP